MARHVEGGANLKDDLAALIERGERLTQHLGAAMRSDLDHRGPLQRSTNAEAEALSVSPRVRSQAERDLLRALRVPR